jgi:hypothetical protein
MLLLMPARLTQARRKLPERDHVAIEDQQPEKSVRDARKPRFAKSGRSSMKRLHGLNGGVSAYRFLHHLL